MDSAAIPRVLRRTKTTIESNGRPELRARVLHLSLPTQRDAEIIVLLRVPGMRLQIDPNFADCFLRLAGVEERVASEATILPKEFQAEVANARRSRRCDHSERLSAEIARRLIELRVIENIEELGPELQRRRFGNCRRLLEREVSIQKSWPMEQTELSTIESSPKTRISRIC